MEVKMKMIKWMEMINGMIIKMVEAKMIWMEIINEMEVKMMNRGEMVKNVNNEIKEKMVMIKWRQRWWCDNKMNGDKNGD